MFIPVIGETLVEVCIFFLGDVFWLSHPKGLNFVLLFIFSGDFLYLFLFLFLFLFFLDFTVFILFFLLIIFIIANLLFSGLFDLEFNGESNEFRVFLNQVLDSSFF
jgi:hypothetical protein